MNKDNEVKTQWVMFITTNPETGEPRYLRKELSLKDAEQVLNLIASSCKEFREQFDRLYPEFEIKLQSLKRTFEEKYHIVPTKEGFLNWFISLKMGMLTINEFYDNSNDTWTFDYIDIPQYDENSFNIHIVNEHLHQYCLMEKIEQDKIEKELVKSITSSKITSTDQAEGKTKTPKFDQDLTLLDLFKEKPKYPLLMNILVEKGWCSPNTYYWNYGKGTFARVLKNLYFKGYYTKDPKNEEYQIVAKNTFQLTIGIDTIKRSNNKITGKPENHNTDLSFIPFATTI